MINGRYLLIQIHTSAEEFYRGKRFVFTFWVNIYSEPGNARFKKNYFSGKRRFNQSLLRKIHPAEKRKTDFSKLRKQANSAQRIILRALCTAHDRIAISPRCHRHCLPSVFALHFLVYDAYRYERTSSAYSVEY